MPTEPPALPDAQTLFDGAPCGLVVTREDGTILQANATFAGWLDYSQTELTGRRFQDLLTMGGRIFHQTHWAPLMQMQGSVAEVKLDLLHRDRRAVTMLLNGVRREHASGAFYELALFGTADRDRYERELLNARKHAEELVREKTVAETALQEAQAELKRAYEKAQRRAEFAELMVAIVSHDLKNPLTAIKMATEMLVRGERTPREARLLGHISQSSDRAQRMIADLLDLALARVGQGIGITRSVFDLQSHIAQSLNELRVAFPQAKLVHQSDGTGTVNLDADRVQQIIGNLVANSVAYGDLQRPITVSSTQQEHAAVIAVHNHGTPIPEAVITGLFEPMTRGTENDNDVRSVGLGLFIVREIVAGHGGTVSVTSTAADGTTFNVYFPLITAIS
jgi:sigma-B regulation protein RsbU (phosphoserine phosphatase)